MSILSQLGSHFFSHSDNVNGSNACQLFFDSVSESQFGEYRCEVRNEGETLISRVVSLLPGMPLPG